MAEQLVFDLPFRAAMGRADFFVSQANAAAVAGVDGWADWPYVKMLLTGPEGAGKTHLAHVWATGVGAEVLPAAGLEDADVHRLSDAPALVLEDADRAAGDAAVETRMFHIHNALAERRAPLLITARKAPPRWGMVLPDLESRMAQAGRLTLDAPDDALLAAVMVKLAQDRQMALTPAMVQYAVQRIERSFAAVQAFLSALDAEALADKERLKQKHVRAALERG